MHKISFPAAFVLASFATTAIAQAPLETDEDRTLYALGIAIGSNIQEFALSADELTIVASGFRDGALGTEPGVDMQVYGPQIQALADSRAAARADGEKQAAEAFLAEMAQEPGAEQSASGVIYIPISAGAGSSPTAADTVRVHYHGTLRDGTVFDSSVQRGEPISFPLTGVIPCWTEGVQKMMVGAKSKLVCPSDTAYGDVGTGPIPGGAALVFEIELLGIE